MKHTLVEAWRHRGWLARLLWPVSRLYGLLLRLRHALYARGMLHAQRFDVAVVVIGNVVAGGAGKTPLVIALARHLQAAGVSAGVVSRGYGRQGDGTLEVLPDTPATASGDEPALIRRLCPLPVFVARRRADAVAALLAAHPGTQVVICDDGLQHTALQRDLEIAVFDDRGVGNGWLLPAGPLREPWPPRGRRPVDLVLHTGNRPAFAGFRSRRALAEHALDASGRPFPLRDLHGRPVAAVAGIAVPDNFFDMLRARGLTLSATVALPDHDDFQRDSLRALQSLHGQTVLCTEKDAVKLFGDTRLQGLDLLAVPLLFEPEAAFFRAFDAALAPFIAHRTPAPHTPPSPLTSSHGHQTT